MKPIQEIKENLKNEEVKKSVQELSGILQQYVGSADLGIAGGFLDYLRQHRTKPA